MATISRAAIRRATTGITLRRSAAVAAIGLGLAIAAHADHASVGLGGGAGSPINTESAATLPAGRFSASLRSEYIRYDGFSDRRLADSQLHSLDALLSTSLGLAWGATDDLTLGVRIPFIQRFDLREADHHVYDHGDGEHTHTDRILDLGDPDGLGDATLFGQFRFFQSEDARTHLAALFGVKLPTGDTHERAAHRDFPRQRLDAGSQPGSGSWDSLFGVAATRFAGAFAYDANLLYTFADTGAQHTNLGDSFSYNAAVSYRLGGGRPATPYDLVQTHAWDLILEVNGEWRDRERGGEHGDKDHHDEGEDPTSTHADNHANNHGGNLVYLSPGVRYLNRAGWGLSLSVGVPVITNLNGTQVEPGYRLITSVNLAF